MKVLCGKDFMEVKLASFIADYDRDTLANLYQPIIGFTGFAVYLSLWSEANNQKVLSIISHDQFFDRMKITAGQFVDARKLLEGIGLMKTFVNPANGISIYRYEIYAPRTVKEFFNNTLLYGMLIKAIGEQEVNKLKSIYNIETNTQKGDDISSSFVDAFKPDFDDPAFKKAINGDKNMIGRSGAKIACEFSFEKFFDCLQSQSQIKPESFDKKDMKEIERLTTLYGLDEEAAASSVIEIYQPLAAKGKHVDYQALAKLFQEQTNYNYIANKNRRHSDTPTVSSDSELAQKINYLERESPAKFLSMLQNGTRPATSDLKIIDSISKDFGLPNGVINVLVEYTLVMNDNVLSRSYVEKVAASLAREGVTNAVDAMNYLQKVKNGRKSTRTTKPVEEPEQVESVEAVVETKTKEPKKEESNLDWDSLIDQIDEGGSDGKA